MTTNPRESIALGLVSARKILRRGVSFTLGNGGLTRTGISWRTAVVAALSTMTLFFLLNLFLIADVRSSFRTARLGEMVKSADAAEAVDRLARAGLLEPDLKGWAKEILSDRPNRKPAQEQILDLFDGVASATEEGRARRSAILEDVATGQLSGFLTRFFWVRGEVPSSTDLFEKLAEADGKPWLRALESDKKAGADKKRFLIAYLNAFLARVQPALREVNRFNGAIKWLATFSSLLILWAVLGRVYLLARLQAYWLGESPIATRTRASRVFYAVLGTLPPPSAEEQAELLAILDDVRSQDCVADRDALVRARMMEVRQASESSVYATYSYGVGLLPSLGFIGTVWGLGSALLQANGLFSVSDRQKTIGHITHELGIAFDTTLIALTASVLTGICIAGLRLRERWLWDQIQLRLLHQPREGATVSPGASRKPTMDAAGLIR